MNKSQTINRNSFRQTAFILIPCLIYIIYMFVSGYINRRNFIKRLKQHQAFASERTTFYKPYYKQPGTATYVFLVNGKEIQGSVGSGQFPKLGKKMYQYSFPVIYNYQDPEYNEILVFPNDFEEYEIPYPDNLYWIKRLD